MLLNVYIIIHFKIKVGKKVVWINNYHYKIASLQNKYNKLNYCLPCLEPRKNAYCEQKYNILCQILTVKIKVNNKHL